MPKGYIIGHVTVNDPDVYKDYVSRNTAIFGAHGGTFLVRGGRGDVVEGTLKDRHVVIEFPSFEAAMAAYEDPDYQDLIKIRRSASEGDILVVEGT